jgi:hypothetical protein
LIKIIDRKGKNMDTARKIREVENMRKYGPSSRWREKNNKITL